MKAVNGGRNELMREEKTQIEASQAGGSASGAMPPAAIASPTQGASSFHGYSASTAMDDPRVAAAMQHYLDALEAGAPPPREAFLAEHSAIADQLASCLDGLALVHAAAQSIQDVGGNCGPLTA